MFLQRFFFHESILMVAGMTAAIVVGLGIFACQTKYDFTGMGPYLFCVMMALFVLSFFMMFIPVGYLANPGCDLERPHYSSQYILATPF